MPFTSLDDYVCIPRVSGLALSPDGTRLVTTVATLNAAGNAFQTCLWEIDPTAQRPARRLTRGAMGEAGACFAPDGSLFFTSRRPDPQAKDDDPQDVTALWELPVTGEARVIASRPGGISALAVARRSGTIAVSSPTFASAVSAADDARIRKQRKDDKVDAILHEQFPVRFWDHDLGPDENRLFVAIAPADTPTEAGNASTDDTPLELRDLTPAPGPGFGTEPGFDISPDGSAVVATQYVPTTGGVRTRLIEIDTATGEQRVLAEDPQADIESPAIDPTGTWVLAVRWRFSTPQSSSRPELLLIERATGAMRRVAPSWDAWPDGAVWASHARAVFVTADEVGHRPAYRIDLADSVQEADAERDVVTRLTGDHGAYHALQVSPDDQFVYALRSAIDAAPAPVRLAARGHRQQPSMLLGPGEPVRLPGRSIQVQTTTPDGAVVHAWLSLPEGCSADAPAPLLLWIHGGPNMSANDWSWRWNPWLMVARGYAVLQPDPALSTGYGQDFIQRGWGRWGSEPYEDLMAITDEVLRRPDIDGSKTAAMGGSFGGYMANWIAGHTDRFKAIVTHASLWNLDAFGSTTDGAHYWSRELSPQMAHDNSPHRFVEHITTPMLVIHGDKDYRVPIGEGLALWAQLAAVAQREGAPMRHKFLYFPNENHWVLTPNHAKVWYETVFAFLDHTVHEQPWVTPQRLN